MAQFRSAVMRSYWLGMVYSAVFDYAVLFAGALFFNDTAAGASIVAAAVLVGIWLFQLAYALVGVAKGALLFFTFEKESRVAATVDQMLAVKMPRPMQFYSDAAEYLVEVVKKPEAGGDARLLAGSLVGFLEALKVTQRPFLYMCLSMVLEEAIKRYGRKVGFVWDNGTQIARQDLDDDEAGPDYPGGGVPVPTWGTEDDDDGKRVR